MQAEDIFASDKRKKNVGPFAEHNASIPNNLFIISPDISFSQISLSLSSLTLFLWLQRYPVLPLSKTEVTSAHLIEKGHHESSRVSASSNISTQRGA